MSSAQTQEKRAANILEFVGLSFPEKLKAILSGFYSAMSTDESFKLELLNTVDRAIFTQFNGEIYPYLLKETSSNNRILTKLKSPEIKLFFSLLESIYQLIYKSGSIGDIEFEQIKRLKFCLLKASIVNPDFFVDSSDLNRQLFSEIYGSLIISQGNKEKLSLIEESISKVVIEFPGVSSVEDINQLLRKILEGFEAKSKEIRNRAFVFERRTCESEFGKSLSWAAKFWSTRQINSLIEKYDVPEFVQEMLQNLWVNVLYLDRLKNPEKIEYQSILTARYLIASLLPIFNKEEFNLVTSLQKEVESRLFERLADLFDSQIKMNSFFEELREHHKQINASLKDEKPKENESESPDIIRLSPTKQLPVTKKSVRVSPARLEIWVENLFAKRIVERSNEGLFSGIQSEKEKAEESKDTIKRLLFPGLWYQIDLSEKKIVAKLSTKLEANDSYVFVDSRGLKVETINESKVIKLIKQNGILPVNEKLVAESLFGQVVGKIVEAVTSRYENQIKSLKKQESERTRVVERELLKKQEREAFLEEKRLEISEAIDRVRKLEVGAWVKVERSDSFKRYKIGAKLMSSNEIVLIDRNNRKVDTISFNRFAEDIVKGSIQLNSDDNLFDLTLR